MEWLINSAANHPSALVGGTAGKPHFYVDEPNAVPVDERDEAKGFFPHAYRCAYPEGAPESAAAE